MPLTGERSKCTESIAGAKLRGIDYVAAQRGIGWNPGPPASAAPCEIVLNSILQFAAGGGTIGEDKGRWKQMTAQTQDKTNRMCDDALARIQGVADDLGFAEATNVFRAQVSAFAVLSANRMGSDMVGAMFAAGIADAICNDIVRSATS